MIDEVNRTEGDLQTTEDEQQTTEDDRGMTEDDQNLQTNKASLNQFECSEMMNYKGMIDEGSSSAVCRSSSIVCRSSSVVCRSSSKGCRSSSCLQNMTYFYSSCLLVQSYQSLRHLKIR